MKLMSFVYIYSHISPYFFFIFIIEIISKTIAIIANGVNGKTVKLAFTINLSIQLFTSPAIVGYG